jgi:hypothetical protein
MLQVKEFLLLKAAMVNAIVIRVFQLSGYMLTNHPDKDKIIADNRVLSSHKEDSYSPS